MDDPTITVCLLRTDCNLPVRRNADVYVRVTGLAGLSVAYTLAKAGHKVQLLEKQNALGVPAAGVRVPPNMSKIFKKWVGEKELYRTAVLNVATPWLECAYSSFFLTT